MVNHPPHRYHGLARSYFPATCRNDPGNARTRPSPYTQRHSGSHGGNNVPCQEVIHRLGLKYRDRGDFWIASAGYWSLADDAMRLPEMETERSTHACEYETSMVLSLRADLVDLAQAEGRHPSLESRYYFPGLTTTQRSKVNVSLPMEQMTSTGAMGRPDLATAEKGHKLLAAITARLIDFIREFASWPRPTEEH